MLNMLCLRYIRLWGGFRGPQMRENASAPRVSTGVYIKSNICSLQGLVLVWGHSGRASLQSGSPTGVQGVQRLKPTLTPPGFAWPRR